MGLIEDMARVTDEAIARQKAKTQRMKNGQ